MLAALEMDANEKIRNLLELVGAEVIAYLRSLTGETRPPARSGGVDRKAHPGGWADVTGMLANSYGFDVSRAGDGWVLRLFNTAEYAAELEARDGYFVLSGVTDPGGPIEQSLRRVVPQVAPGWVVR
jgi:hypothetical protein